VNVWLPNRSGTREGSHGGCAGPGHGRACHHRGVFTVLGYVFALLVVGGLLFLAASFAFGRGEEMAPVLPDGTPVELPDDRLAGGEDLRALRLSVTVRGYRMDEVDWLLDRLSEQVDTRDREIARLRSVLHVEEVPVPDEPELLTHPVPAVVTLDPYPDPTPTSSAGPASRTGDDAPAPVLPEPAGTDAAGPPATGSPTTRDPAAAQDSATTRDSADYAGEPGIARRPREVRDPEPLDPDAPRLGAGDPTRGLPRNTPDPG
jgi:DivIVA domain-containing protein